MTRRNSLPSPAAFALDPPDRVGDPAMTDHPPYPYLPSSEALEPTKGYSQSVQLIKTVVAVAVAVVVVVPGMTVVVEMMLAPEAKS